MHLPKEIAQPLKQLVTNKPLLDGLSAYIDYRLNEVNKTLQDSLDVAEMHRAQGQARELKRMLNIRKEVLAEDK